MIDISSSVKPRVVIFHMTASQSIRSSAPLQRQESYQTSEGKSRTKRRGTRK